MHVHEKPKKTLTNVKHKMPCQNNIFLLNWYHHLVADLETFVSMLPPLESSEIIFFWQ